MEAFCFYAYNIQPKINCGSSSIRGIVIVNDGVAHMKIFFLSCLFLFSLPTLAQAESTDVSRKACQKTCLPVDLTRGKQDEPLSRGKINDELTKGKQAENLASNKLRDDLSHGKDSAVLDAGKQSSELNRGLETKPFQTIRSRDDLSRSNLSKNLAAGRKGDDLSRSVLSNDLGFNRVRDDLSRGRESASLSRCD